MSLPQVRVFAPDGKCLGVIALDSTSRGTLAERSNELIGRPQKNCNMHISNDMRSEPSLEGGPGKYVAELVMFDMGFCTACQEMEAELRNMAARDTDMGEWTLVKVSDSAAFNPERPGADSECADCAKKQSD